MILIVCIVYITKYVLERNSLSSILQMYYSSKFLNVFSNNANLRQYFKLAQYPIPTKHVVNRASNHKAFIICIPSL